MTPLRFARGFAEFRRPSWAAWLSVLKRVTPSIRELFVIAGRGSGKSRIVALLAAWAATRQYKRAAGEDIYIGVFGPDRRQARVTFRYIAGLLRSDPSLAALIVAETRERIELREGIIIEVITASKAAPRGRSYALAVIEEASMLPVDDTAADPDVEILRAIRPALGRVPGSLLCVIGTPYARRGVLYDAWRAGDAPDRLVIAADTLTLNPSFDRATIDRAFEVDPIAARSEYGRDGTITFREDVSGLLADEALQAIVPAGVREVAPDALEGACVAHFDAATGSGNDAAALAIAERGNPARLLCIRRWRPPFSPAAVIAEAAALLRRYRVNEVGIDRFAPGLVADRFRDHGIAAHVAERDTSAAFLDLLALVNSRRVSLLDDAALLNELRRLERRPGAGGRDQIAHAPQGHDDLAAAAAQALIAAAQRAKRRAGLWDNEEGDRRSVVSNRRLFAMAIQAIRNGERYWPPF
jgi:hypothetical protein